MLMRPTDDSGFAAVFAEKMRLAASHCASHREGLLQLDAGFMHKESNGRTHNLRCDCSRCCPHYHPVSILDDLGKVERSLHDHGSFESHLERRCVSFAGVSKVDFGVEIAKAEVERNGSSDVARTPYKVADDEAQITGSRD